MQKTALFVDGSFLAANLRRHNLAIDDYALLFSHLHRRATSEWAVASMCEDLPATMCSRIYLYAVSTMDEWDLSNERVHEMLRGAFEKDRDLRTKYLGEAGDVLSALDSEQRPHEHLLKLAWDRCFTDLRSWYLRQQSALDTLQRFYYALETSNDLIELVGAGHWRIDLLAHRLDEQGIDAALSLDLGTRAHEFDLAVVLAEGQGLTRAFSHLQTIGRHITVVELLPGTAPEDQGRSAPSHLRTKADFVTRIFADDLVTKGLARRVAPNAFTEQAPIPVA